MFEVGESRGVVKEAEKARVWGIIEMKCIDFINY